MAEDPEVKEEIESAKTAAITTDDIIVEKVEAEIAEVASEVSITIDTFRRFAEDVSTRLSSLESAIATTDEIVEEVVAETVTNGPEEKIEKLQQTRRFFKL